ncbi:MAG: hypothetical protein ABI629_15760 [bacterium]
MVARIAAAKATLDEVGELPRGELVGASRSLVLRMALAEGLRVLARRYGRE